MTFPARLTELLEKATKGPYLLEKGIVGRPTITGAGLIGRSTIAEFCDDAEGWADAESFLLFLNHAEALRDLVVAAKLLHDNLAEYQQINKIGGYDNQDMRMMREALAKLEEQ